MKLIPTIFIDLTDLRKTKLCLAFTNRFPIGVKSYVLRKLYLVERKPGNYFRKAYKYTNTISDEKIKFLT